MVRQAMNSPARGGVGLLSLGACSHRSPASRPAPPTCRRRQAKRRRSGPFQRLPAPHRPAVRADRRCRLWLGLLLGRPARLHGLHRRHVGPGGPPAAALHPPHRGAGPSGHAARPRRTGGRLGAPAQLARPAGERAAQVRRRARAARLQVAGCSGWRVCPARACCACPGPASERSRSALQPA